MVFLPPPVGFPVVRQLKSSVGGKFDQKLSNHRLPGEVESGRALYRSRSVIHRTGAGDIDF